MTLSIIFSVVTGICKGKFLERWKNEFYRSKRNGIEALIGGPINKHCCQQRQQCCSYSRSDAIC